MEFTSYLLIALAFVVIVAIALIARAMIKMTNAVAEKLVNSNKPAPSFGPMRKIEEAKPLETKKADPDQLAFHIVGQKERAVGQHVPTSIILSLRNLVKAEKRTPYSYMFRHWLNKGGGFTLPSLSKKTGMGENNLKRYLRGKTKNPTATTREKIAHAFGVSYPEFVSSAAIAYKNGEGLPSEVKPKLTPPHEVAKAEPEPEIAEPDAIEDQYGKPMAIDALLGYWLDIKPMSSAVMAKLVGISKEMINRHKKHGGNPHMSTLKGYAKAFDLTYDEFMLPCAGRLLASRSKKQNNLPREYTL